MKICRKCIWSGIAVGVVLLVWMAFSDPTVTIEVLHDSNYDFVIEIKSIRISGASDIRVWSETRQEALWAIRSIDRSLNSVKYGLEDHDAKQLFPVDQKRPRKVLPNEEIVIAVDYTFDDLVYGVACMGTRYAKIRFNPDGRIGEMKMYESVPRPSSVRFE